MATAGEIFLNAVSRATGVDPGVLGYWMNQEGTYAPRGTGGYNFLNLRPKGTAGDYSAYTGVPISVSPGRFEQFRNVNDAISETVNRIRQPFMQALMNTVKQGGDPAAQWKAIEGTGWDINHYAGSGFAPTTDISLPGPVVDSSGAATAAAEAAARATTSASSGSDGTRIGGDYDPSSAIAFARQYIGTPYSWGGGSPSGPTYGLPGTSGATIKGFDCSGLVQSALLHAGVTGIGRTSYDQWGQGQRVNNTADLQPGDVVFFKGTDSEIGPNGQVLPGHEALYIGSGKVIVAPQTGEQVKLADLSSFGDYMGARRYVASAAAGTAAATRATTAIGQKAVPQPKPKAIPVPATTPLQGAQPGAMASILNTPSAVAFHDPFVFKPGITHPAAAVPLIPTPTTSTLPTTTTPMPAFKPFPLASPSFMSALTGR